MTKSVLHIAPTPFFADRGCHIRIAGIEKSIAALGYSNIVCTYHHGRDVDGVKTRRIKPIPAYTQTEAGPSKYKLQADWRLMWLVFNEVRKNKPDVIHAHLHEGLMIGIAVKTMLFWKRIGLIADMQGSLLGELDEHGAFKKRAWLRTPVRLIEKTLLKLARTVVCSSAHSMEKFAADFNLNRDKLFLVQDGADPAGLVTETELAAHRAKYKIPGNKTIVMYTGGLVGSKGLDNLQEVITLCRELDHVHFVIVGYPTENIAPYLEQHGLMDKCTLTGQTPFEELPRFLALADIAIDPKKGDAGEGSGKMLNYLASGLPILAFETQNNRDFLPPDTDLVSSANEMAEKIAEWTSGGTLDKIRDRNFA
ncbi:MAG: glycosyltransferase, partial [Pseudomonadota bacterium]